MKIDPNHLQILAAIIDSGGLGEAAVSLGKSQPSLSRTISMLEARLGSRLFEKGRKPLRPTELCQSLAVQGRIISQAGIAAQTAVELYSVGKSGTVRLAGTPIFMDGVISRMIASFQTTFPDVAIHQTYGYLEKLIEQLNVGSIDLAICPVRPDRVPPGMSFKPLLRGRNVIACASLHPLARRASFKPSDIAPFPWIAPPANSPLYDDLRQALKSIGNNDFRVSFTGGSLASILSVIAGSEALTILPDSVVYMQRQTKSLTALPIMIDHPDRVLGILWRIGNPIGPSVLRFRTYLETEFKDLHKRIDAKQRQS